MNDGYYICEKATDGAFAEISKEELKQLSNCKETIWEIVSAEELFSLIPLAYEELEVEMFKLTLEYSLVKKGHENTEHLFDDLSQLLNLRVLNILNAAKAYQDQLLKICSGLNSFAPDLHTKVEENFNSLFDNSFEYRIMEALRNHAQHHALPLQGNSLDFASFWEQGKASSEVPSRSRVTLNPYFSGEALINNKKLNAKTRNELKLKNVAAIDAKVAIRRYISSMFLCHKNFRELTVNVIEDSLRVLKSAEDKLMKVKGLPVNNMEAVNYLDGKTEQRVYIDSSWLEGKLEKRKHWTGLATLERRYISNEIHHKKDRYQGEVKLLWIPK